MTYLTQRFLIVFSDQGENQKKIDIRIQHYKDMIKRSEVLQSRRVEYFLLYVAPSMPAYALQTPEILALATQQREKSETKLMDIGMQLGIGPEKQFFSEGNTDFQAWRLARVLKVDRVFGYSKPFIQYLNLCKSLHYAFSYIAAGKKRLLKYIH